MQTDTIDRLERRVEAMRLNAGLSGNQADFDDLDELYDKLNWLRDEETRLAEDRRIKRKRQARELYEYCTLRRGFTVSA